MESYDSKKSIDINRDSGIVSDEYQQFISLDDLDASFNSKTPNHQYHHQSTSTNDERGSSSSALGHINYTQDEDGDTILHLAVVGCTPDVVDDLMKRCDLNSTNNMKQTPLHIASMANRPEMVELLLSGGAKINVHDWKGNTPLHSACERGFSDVVITLLETVSIDSIAQTEAAEAAKKNSDSNLRHYLELKNFDGQSCLHLAAAHNRINILDLLINRYNVDINCQDSKSGATILHEAITKFNNELVRYILSMSKHCDRRDFYGRRPLDMIALLQRSRLDQNQRNKLGHINELVKDRIKLCIGQNIGCCAATSLSLNDAILDSSSSSDYTDSESDVSN